MLTCWMVVVHVELGLGEKKPASGWSGSVLVTNLAYVLGLATRVW
jgi:hypothetical protein